MHYNHAVDSVIHMMVLASESCLLGLTIKLSILLLFIIENFEDTHTKKTVV